MFISPIYVCLLLLLALSVIFPQKRILIYVNILILFAMGVFRGVTVGYDCWGYSADYHILNDFKDIYKIAHDFELGFVALIVWFKKVVTEDYLPFVSLLFIPFYCGCLKFMHYKDISYPLALFVLYTWGFYFFAYNAMRQMMVVGIILLFIPWLYKEKYVKFAAVVIVTALLFHRSAVIMLMLIPFHYWVAVKGVFPAKKWLYILVLGSFAMFFVGKTFLQNLLLPIVLLYDSSYSYYILGYEVEELGFMYNLGQAIAACLLIFMYKRGAMDFEMWVFILGIAVYNIMGMFSTYGFRLALYWTIFGVVLIPHILQFRNRGISKSVAFYCFMAYTFYRFFYSYYLNNIDAVNPYLLR